MGVIFTKLLPDWTRYYYDVLLQAFKASLKLSGLLHGGRYHNVASRLKVL